MTQYRGKYSLEVLKQALLQDGCPPDRLLEAIRKVQAPPLEASEHFQRAMAIDAKEGDIQALNEQASELSLAIRKANGDYPSAHAMLGLTLWMLGDEKRARHECEIAIQQNNNHVFARCLLLSMDGEKLGIPGFFKTSSGSFIVDIAFLGGGLFFAHNKLNAFSSKIDELIATHPAYLSDFINEPDDAGIWIFNSDFMLRLHDAVQAINGLKNKDRIANAVVNAPWDKLLALNLSDEDRKQVDEIRRRAEGRVLLSRAK